MFGTRRYVGRHRVPDEKQDITTVRKTVMGSKWVRRIGVPVATFMAITLGIGSAAFAAPVRVVSGDTFSELVREHCGTSDWQSVAFPGRDKNLIYAGETIDITCAKTETANTATNNNPAPVQRASSGWVSPVCAGLGDNIGAGRGHKGIDMSAGYGTPIRAAASGTLRTGWQSGAGNYSVIDHGGGVATAYLHQSSYEVRSGWVNADQIIGYVGSTGKSSGPHLHFEVWTNGYWVGTFQDPYQWYANQGVRLGC